MRTIIVIILAVAALFLTWWSYRGGEKTVGAPQRLTATPATKTTAPAAQVPAARPKTLLPAQMAVSAAPANTSAARQLDLSIDTAALDEIAQRNELHASVQKNGEKSDSKGKGVDISPKLLFDDKAEKTTEMVNGTEINVKVPFD